MARALMIPSPTPKPLPASTATATYTPATSQHLIAGVGTETLEMLEDAPDLDAIIVPIGGGSGASGACITAKAINPAIRVIGVQSALSPAAFESWRAQQVCTAPNQTLAEGLATGKGFELPQEILWSLLDDFILVSDEEIMQAMVWMVQHAHTLAEAAGASPLAAAYQLREICAGTRWGWCVRAAIRHRSSFARRSILCWGAVDGI